jgi:hypothetical protein
LIRRLHLDPHVSNQALVCGAEHLKDCKDGQLLNVVRRRAAVDHGSVRADVHPQLADAPPRAPYDLPFQGSFELRHAGPNLLRY